MYIDQRTSLGYAPPGLGFWDTAISAVLPSLVSGLTTAAVKVGEGLVLNRINTDAIKKQMQAQADAQIRIAQATAGAQVQTTQAQAALEQVKGVVTSDMFKWGALAIVGVAGIYLLMRSRKNPVRRKRIHRRGRY